MDISTAFFTHFSFNITTTGDQNPQESVIKPVNKGGAFVPLRFKGLNAYIRTINHTCQCSTRFVDSQSLPIWACRRLSTGALDIVLTNKRVVEFFDKHRIDLKERRSIARSYFQSLINPDDYECLTDPIDIKFCDKDLSLKLFGYKIKTGLSVVAGITIGYQGSDAQSIIDITSDSSPFPQVRKTCLKYLRHICGLHNLSPREMQIELLNNPAGVAFYSGGFVDVFKCMDRGLEVAVKVLRICSNDNLGKVANEAIVWKSLQHPNILPLLGVLKDRSQFKFAMVSEWMANGSINSFVRARRDVNQFKLLADAARGLIYLHSQGIIHGDLKGDNILVDENESARLADFGLLMISDLATTGSREQGGSIRWMSPELLDPENFGLERGRQTQSSDCYALGMVVYEVLSGHVPFPLHRTYVAAVKVLRGECPERPEGLEGELFTDDVWDTLEYCWKPKPSNCPSIDYVLHSLGEASGSQMPSRSLVVGLQVVGSPTWTTLDLSTEGSVSDSSAFFLD
ncbi:kinase-like protein [Thelephora ganbajun]|uniref:Kinase-like protein n=1 Tax=Thelephora ganbajun TaxID=370292 RepID=A0ACB6ZB28_THEGA|nr:kinase-like protein [Thelephora ganbajun]